MRYNDIEFNGTHVTETDFELWCNFIDSNPLWIGGRLLVLVKPTGGALVTLYVENPQILSAYTPDANGYVIIDLTDIARTYGDIGAASLIQIEDGTDDYEVLAGYTNVRLINPTEVPKPYFAAMESDAYLAPPRRLIAPWTGLSIICELQYPSGDDWYRVDASTLYSEALTSDSFSIPNTMPRFFLWTDSYSGKDYYYNLAPRLCERNYVAVRWRSLTGVTRLHMMEYCKQEFNVGDKFSLIRLDNAPIVAKGRTEVFTIKIDGLDAYGIWYYGDIATSGLVEVSFDGTNWQRVDILTNSVQVPDGDAENGKVELKATFKKYDAVVM